MKPSVLVVAGGTGGHISPGRALADACLQAGAAVSFLSLEKDREHPDFARCRFPLYFYDAPRIRLRPSEMFFLPLRFLRAFFAARRVLKNSAADRVVGMGGYPTLPALVAALLLRLPVYLCEQNTVPGRATKLFARFARGIFTSFPLKEGFLEGVADRTFLTGNPLRSGMVASGKGAGIFERLESGERAELRILVLGGSQGARQINRMVVSILEETPFAVWIVQCGRGNIAEMRAELPEENYGRLFLLDFHPQIEDLYRDADLLVCRAGAGVLSEAACFGLPIVLIPYPYAKDNHQKGNAEYFERHGAAVLLDQRDENGLPLLRILKRLNENPEELEKMGQATRSLAQKNAAQKITNHICLGR